MSVKPNNIFPQAVIAQYLKTHVVPYPLTSQCIKDYAISPKGLLDHTQDVINLLEGNKQHEDVYQLQAPVFESLFTQFAECYANQSLNEHDQYIRFNLVKIEQTIHLITDISATQDISTHLKLIEEICEDERICEMILLLYRKYSTWYDGYSELYVSWMHFLLPYMEFLVTMNCECSKMLSMKKEHIEDMVKVTLEKIQKILAEENIRSNIKAEDIYDAKKTLAKIIELKKEYVKISTTRDDQFYYGLGLISFAFHLVSLSTENSYILINISLLSSLSLSLFKRVSTDMKREIASFQVVEDFRIDSNYLKNCLTHMVTIFSQQPSSPDLSTTMLKILANLLNVMVINKADPIYLIRKSSIDAKSLIEELFTIVEVNQEFLKSQGSSFLGVLNTLYDDIQWMLLKLIQRLFMNLPNGSFSEYKELNSMMSHKNKVFSEMNSFNANKYYQIRSLLASLDHKSKEIIIENGSLSELKLKELYSDDYANIIDLKFNLFYTHSFLAKEFEVNEKLKNSFYTSFTPILEAYLKEISEELTNNIQINRLKYLGIFATRMLAHNTSGLKKLKLKFLLTFARFILTHKSEFDQWDVISFQPDFFLVLQRLDDAHNVFFDDVIVSLLSLCEEHMSKAKIIIPLFSADSQLWKVNQARKKLETLILESLENIKISLDIDWGKIDFGRLEENEQKQILTNLRLSSERFVYYTLQCFTCFISTTKNIKDPETLKSFNNIIKNISHIYFHPALRIFVQEPEKAIVHASLSTKILQENSSLIKNHVCANNNVDQHFEIPDFGFTKFSENSINPFESIIDYRKSISKAEVEAVSIIFQLERYRHPSISQDTNQQSKPSNLIKALVKSIAQFGSDLIKKANQGQTEANSGQRLGDETQKSLHTLITGAYQYLKSWGDLNYVNTASLDFFRSLLDVSINALNPALEDSLSILDTIIEFVSTIDGLASQIFEFILAQKKSWSFVVNRITSSITTEPDSKGAMTRRERFMNSISQMKPYLEYLKQEGKKIPGASKNSSHQRQQEQALAESFFELAECLRSFPITTVIALDDSEINAVAAIVLHSFQNSYLCSKYKITADIEATEKTSISKEDKDLKLKELDSSNDLYDRDFKLSLDLLGLIYPFKLYRTPGQKEPTLSKEKVIYTILNFLNKFFAGIMNEIPPQADPQPLYSSDIDYRETTELIEVKLTENYLLNKLLTLKNYLSKLMNSLVQCSEKLAFQESFIYNLYQVSLFLIKQLLNQTEPELSEIKDIITSKLEDIKILTQDLARLLLTYNTCNYLQTKPSNKPELIPAVDWVRLIIQLHTYMQRNFEVTLLDVSDELFKSLMGLIHVSLYADIDSSSDSLFSNTSLLQSVFSLMETKTLCNVSVVSPIILVFDALFENSLPEELVIEAKLKQGLMASGNIMAPQSLNSLNQSGIVGQKRLTNSKTLISVLRNKFKISSDIKAVGPQDQATLDNIEFSLDPSLESSAELRVKEILVSISSNAQKGIHILSRNLINNYLSNISALYTSDCTSTEQPQSFREVLSIVNMISILITKNHYLRILLAFQKNDYSDLLTLYQSGVPFLSRMDLDNFRSMTFLECLCEIRYFSIHGQESLVFIGALIRGHTGFTFLDTQNTQGILDLVHVIIVEVLSLLKKESEAVFIEQGNDDKLLGEKYLSLLNTINGLDVVWKTVNLFNKKASSLRSEFKRVYLDLIRHIVNSFQFMRKDIYKVLMNYGLIDKILLSHITDYYQFQIDQTSLSQKVLDNIKKENYKDFLMSAEDLGPHMEHSEFIKPIKTELREDMKNPSKRYAISKADAELLHNDIVKMINKSPYFSNTLTIAVNQISIIVRNFSLTELTETKMNAINKMENAKATTDANSTGQLKLGVYLAKAQFTFENDAEAKVRSISLFIVPCTDLLNYKVTAPSDLPSQPNMNNTIAQQLHKEIDSVHTESINERDPNPPAAQRKDSLVDKEVGIDKEASPQADSQVSYFLHLSLSNGNHFNMLKNQVSIKLKVLSEKISVALSALNVNPEDLYLSRKKLIATEVSNHLESLTIFEKNLSLCLLEQFETLRLFDCPSKLKEVKEELQWLETHFEQYMEIIQKVPGYKSAQVVSEDEIIALHENLSFVKEFQFCVDEPSGDQPITEDQFPRSLVEKNSTFLKDIYPSDDGFVEALISLFFDDYNESLTFTQSRPGQIVEKLCYAATLEMKVVDFCITLIYSPEQIRMLATIFNISLHPEKDSDDPTSKTYESVACNVLKFLAKLLQTRKYLMLQPRAYLERYGLRSLQDFKKKTEFMKRTSCMISIYDLLVGLSNVAQISSSIVLLPLLSSLNLNESSIYNKLIILKVQEGEELKEMTNVLTTKSCKQLLQKTPLGSIIREYPIIVLGDIELLINLIQDQQALLIQPVEETNSVLKAVIRVNEKEISSAHIRPMEAIQASLRSFASGLALSSLLLSKWLREKHEVIKKGGKLVSENQMLYEQAFKEINAYILQDLKCEALIISLFELADYLSSPAFGEIEEKDILIKDILKALISFCTLRYIKEAAKKSVETVVKQNETAGNDFPSLSNFTSCNSVDGLPVIPELSHTFSILRQLRQFDFDVLLTNACKKHQKYILDIITEENPNGSGRANIYIICKKLPWIIDLSTKKIIFDLEMSNQLERIPGGDGVRTININRKDVLGTTIREYSNKSLGELKQAIFVAFEEEEGYDAGGPKREFLTLINQELFDPRKGIFQISASSNNIQISPSCQHVPSHLKYLELAGMMLAKCIQEGCVVDVNLSKPLLKHLLGKKIILNDLEDVDPDLTKSLKWMMNNSVEGLEQTFSYEIEILGQYVTRELVPNGYEVIVTDENRQEFIDKLCEAKVRGEVKEELEVFKRGFNRIVPAEFLSLMTPSELQLTIAGISVIDIEEMKKTAEYPDFDEDEDSGFKANIWEVLSELSQKELFLLIYFISGSTKIPSGGFKEQAISFRKSYESSDSLPVAHTCFWEIELPKYDSKDEIKQKLLWAIYEGQGTFELS